MGAARIRVVVVALGLAIALFFWQAETAPLRDALSEEPDRDLEALLARASSELAGLKGDQAVDKLNALVFDELGFAREVERKDVELMLPAHVVRARRGSCLGLAAVYLLIAERIGLPLRGVLVPGHFFVRLEDGDRVRNIELLRRGEELPDAWYEARYGVPPHGRGRAYLHGLTPAETAAVFSYNLGNAWRARGDQDQARAAYERAVESFPDLAEAHASLGLLHQETRSFALAERAYLRAVAANACLPGLDRNLAALYRSAGNSAKAELHARREGETAARCAR